MSILQVNNLNKSFGNNHVLKDITFSMNQGEVLALIGSSGGGKTTLLRCLTFLEKIQQGSIAIDDTEIVSNQMYARAHDHDKHRYKSIYPQESKLRIERLKMGLVFQSFHLFPHMTVLDNLTLAPMQVQGVTKVVAEELAIYQLTRLGLADKIHSYPYELSGGQQQRVAIARAITLNPKILCFDEPTSALDPELIGEVIKTIKLLKDSKMTLIIVTHDINFARQIADRVMFIANGVIEEMGSASQVFDNPQSYKTKQFIKGYSDLQEV